MGTYQGLDARLDEGSGLEMVHVSDVLDYLGQYLYLRQLMEGKPSKGNLPKS